MECRGVPVYVPFGASVMVGLIEDVTWNFDCAAHHDNLLDVRVKGGIIIQSPRNVCHWPSDNDSNRLCASLHSIDQKLLASDIEMHPSLFRINNSLNIQHREIEATFTLFSPF